MTLAARKVRRGDQIQAVVEDAEHRVVLEVDARDILPDRLVGQVDAEAEAAVFCLKGEQMVLERCSLEPGQFAGRHLHVSQ